MLRFLWTALAAGVCVAAGDACFGAWSARPTFSFLETLELIGALSALAIVPSTGIGLVEALLFGGIGAARPWRRFLALRHDARADRRFTAWVLAVALGVAVFAGMLALVATRLFLVAGDTAPSEGVIASRALVMAGVAVLLLLAAALFAWTIARLARSLLDRVPEKWRSRVPFGWWAIAFVGVGLVVVAMIAVALRLELLRALDLRLAVALAAFVLLQAGFLAAWRKMFRPRVQAWLSGARRAIALGAAVSAAAIAVNAWTVLRFDDATLLGVALEHTTVGSRTLSLWRRALDRDGDGFAALLGGGDCNDRDPRVHPGARDVPLNGIDEDCTGADARPALANADVAKPSQKERRRTGHNVLLVTVDTLRADHLGAYGYARPTSPHIDAFAKTAVVFERTYAAANHTPRAIPALLSGLYPSRIVWKTKGNYPALSDETPTLASELKAAGYRTAGVFPHWYFHKRRNLHRQFDIWDLSAAPPHDDGSAITAPAVTARAKMHLRELAKSPSPFFLWVHYFEPHYPYVEHKGARRFGTKMLDRYDGEVRFVDAYVGELLRELEAVGAATGTVVVLTSDHGEAFGEHKNHWHGHALYDEQVRVPLLVRAPGVAAGRVPWPVSTVDVVPTVLDALGLKARAEASGQSLIALARGSRPMVARPVFVELLAYPNFRKTMRAVIVGDLKLIHDVTDNRYQLFDLGRDPQEQDDLAAQRPAEIERLRDLLARLVEGSPLAALR
jgi:arylsulfatase A-like enzyme